MKCRRFDRWCDGSLPEKLTRPYVHPVFEARQTGKCTLLRALLPPETLVVAFADPRERTRHLADPGAFLEVCRALPADRKGQFVFVHLEEEIRREAVVKDWGAFVRFLQLAAAESGQIVNFAAISQESGVSQPTVKSYYQLLEDMFVGFRVEGFSRSPRKALLSTPKFLFFDLGVRHAAAGLAASTDVVKVNPGAFFEQWVGIELWKRLQYLGEGRLFHLRTKDGAEVDFIIERAGALTPIEVKWSERPTLQDARHLLTFLQEHPKQAPHGYVVCRCSQPLRLHDRITALPWFFL
jgi:hypothetical protein